MDEAVLAIDAGTSSVKAGLLDRAGRVLARSTRRYEYVTPRLHHVELDFEQVWSGTAEAVRELMGQEGAVRAVGLSVLCPGLVPLDARGTRCGRRSSTWTGAASGRPAGRWSGWGRSASCPWPPTCRTPAGPP